VSADRVEISTTWDDVAARNAADFEAIDRAAREKWADNEELRKRYGKPVYVAEYDRLKRQAERRDREPEPAQPLYVVDAAPPPHSAAELLTAEYPPLEWAIEGVLYKNEPQSLVLHGETGVGKTFAILQQGISLIRGTPWIGLPTTAITGNVAFILGETSARFFQSRMLAIDPDVRDIAPRIPVVWVTSDRMHLESEQVVSDVIHRLTDNGVEAVYPDNLTTLFPTWKLSSADGDAGRVMDIMTRLKTEGANRLVPFVAHDRKTSSQGRAGSDIDQVSGDSRLVRSPDVGIRIERKGTLLHFTLSKSRDGAAREWWGEQSQGGVIVPCDAPEKATDRRHSRLEAIVSIIAAKHSAKFADVVEGLDDLKHRASDGVIKSDLTLLVNTKRLLREGKSSATTYRVPE